MLSDRFLSALKPTHGYITLELLISMSLIAIIMCWSITSYTSHYSQVRHVTGQLYHLLNTARLLASSKKVPINLYPLDTHGRVSNHWNTTHIAIDIGENRYQTITIPKVPLTWRASLGNHQRIIFQANSNTDGEQGRFRIGCIKGYPCYHLVVNYYGHIQRFYPNQSGLRW